MVSARMMVRLTAIWLVSVVVTYIVLAFHRKAVTPSLWGWVERIFQ
jgi:hypothetical protein